MAKMTSNELKAAISRQIKQAIGSLGDEISTSRGESFERYMAAPYGDEVEDRSSVVSTDVADTIEWIMPELMELFTAGDKPVSFEPEGPEDEDAAEQETETVEYVFNRQNDGFMTLYSFIKDGLIQKNGYVKRRWEKRDRVTEEEYEGLTIFEWQAMQERWARQGWEVEVLKEEFAVEGVEDMGAEMDMADPMAMNGITLDSATVNVEVKLTRVEEKLRVEPVPPEEILISPRWNKVQLDGCPFIAHRRPMTVSDLVELGYDKKQAMSLPDAFDDELAEERVERFQQRGQAEYDEYEEIDDTMREVLVHECYAMVDWNGDGKAELRRIMVGGTGYEILKFEGGEEDNDEVEVQPFSAWTPVPIPHRHFGRGVSELIEDLQRIKTVLIRQLLDNIYLNNNPTREIAEAGMIEGVTLSDLLHERPGKVLRTAQPGHYMEHTPPQFIGQLLPAIEYVDTLRENRTGVTRYNQGLDANSLNKTATGIQKILTSSMKKLLLYARICAETGLRHLFMGIHGDLRRNASKQMTIRLRNQFVPVDPRAWTERADLTVSIGLGSTDKEMKMAFLERIIMEIKEHLLAGSPMTTPAHLFNAYERFITNAGFKTPEEFFLNPASNPQAGQMPQQQGQQGGGEAQAYMQAEAMKAQQRQQEAQQDGQIDVFKARLEDDRERDKMNMEFALRIAEMNAKGQTAITLEQIRAAARSASAMNQPPNGMAQ